jgi:hypothetical protein
MLYATATISGLILGSALTTIYFMVLGVRYPKAYIEFSSRDAKKAALEITKNWKLDYALGNNYLKDLSQLLVETFDDGVALGAKERGQVIRIYRKQVELAEAMLNEEKRSWSLRRTEWEKERERFVKLWRATKRLMSVTSIAGDPERDVVSALKEIAS